MTLGKYANLFTMVLATVLSAVLAAMVGDSIISPQEWANIAIIGVGALSVFTAPNIPGAKYVKTAIAFLTAVLTVLVTVIVGGIGTAEIIQMILAGLAAIGVHTIPNTQDK
jgi:hypothetical protein